MTPVTVSVPFSSSVALEVEATGSSSVGEGIKPISSASNLARVSLHKTPLGNLSPRLRNKLEASDGTDGEKTRSRDGKKCLRKERRDLRTWVTAAGFSGRFWGIV